MRSTPQGALCFWACDFPCLTLPPGLALAPFPRLSIVGAGPRVGWSSQAKYGVPAWQRIGNTRVKMLPDLTEILDISDSSKYCST